MVTRRLHEEGDERVITYSYKFRKSLERQAVAA
jgi:hypothetical protein